jgi:outer membrane beta-barrel protein
MRLPPLLAACLVCLPVAALAQQEMPGLDLTDEPKAPEPGKPALAPAALPPDAAPRARAAAQAAASAADAKLSEAEIASEDRVKSVQRKAWIKRGRFELTPMGFLTLNDAFYPKYGPGGRVSYHVADALAVGVRYQHYSLIPDDNVRLAKRQLQAQLPYVLPEQSVGLDVMWSPIYGKVSVGSSIRHFDLYVLGGAGAMFSQTSSGSAPNGGDGPHLTTTLGLGQRFALNDWITIDLSLLEMLYSDRPQGQTKAVLQHALTLNLGVGFFLPTSFEYKEP